MCQKSGKINKLIVGGGVVVLLLDLVLQCIFRKEDFGIENWGVSFGVGQGLGVSVFVITIVVLLLGIYLFRGEKGKAVSLIALGGIGNLFSRVIWGSVWDYVCIPLLPFCFNLADILICLGVVSYILGVNGNRSTLRRQRDTSN
jgi:lipoprotein signal peptidase